MAIIKLPLLFRDSKNDKYIYTLFDSRANYSFLRRDIAEQLDPLIALREPMRLATADANNYYAGKLTERQLVFQ